jgi:hypothetical protein
MPLVDMAISHNKENGRFREIKATLHFLKGNLFTSGLTNVFLMTKNRGIQGSQATVSYGGWDGLDIETVFGVLDLV